MEREAQEVYFKNTQNAAVILMVTQGQFNFNFLTSPRECILNIGQMHKR